MIEDEVTLIQKDNEILKEVISNLSEENEKQLFNTTNLRLSDDALINSTNASILNN